MKTSALLLALAARRSSRAAAVAAAAAPPKRRRPSPRPRRRPPRVLVYYFHGTTRCATCRTIEAYAHETVTTAFAAGPEGAQPRVAGRQRRRAREPALRPRLPALHALGRRRGREGPEALQGPRPRVAARARQGGVPEVRRAGDPRLPAFLMDAPLAVAASALWLGLLTSVSPCPLAANIAAMSYVGREVGSRRRTLCWRGSSTRWAAPSRTRRSPRSWSAACCRSRRWPSSSRRT